ncbi:MAG: aminodeoxychorismate/anthranilate synthase component II [Myxococcota bacterium]|nr:aminodeoxychorismate/anthranilate synthase component II [Myxococcota bacterium]
MKSDTPRLLVIDNYDSFTFNLVQAYRSLGVSVAVARNDTITVAQALERRPTHLLISPGPGRPEEGGVSMPLLRAALGRLPILGVCLGHQALAVVLGGRVVPAATLMHGKSSRIEHDGVGLFAGVSRPMRVGRYHSLAVEEASLPACLEVTARSKDGEIMAMRHRALPATGVQFHPESILTPEGITLMRNFITSSPTEPRR